MLYAPRDAWHCSNFFFPFVASAASSACCINTILGNSCVFAFVALCHTDVTSCLTHSMNEGLGTEPMLHKSFPPPHKNCCLPGLFRSSVANWPLVPFRERLTRQTCVCNVENQGIDHKLVFLRCNSAKPGLRKLAQRGGKPGRHFGGNTPPPREGG